jgi:hypothetical protein
LTEQMENTVVYNYHMELVRSNPRSTVAVTLNPDETDKSVFERLYICLQVAREVFLLLSESRWA